jgi:uncharacterized protein YcfL
MKKYFVLLILPLLILTGCTYNPNLQNQVNSLAPDNTKLTY